MAKKSQPMYVPDMPPGPKVTHTFTSVQGEGAVRSFDENPFPRFQ